MAKLRLFGTPQGNYKLVAEDSEQEVLGLQVVFDEVEKRNDALYRLFWNSMNVGKVEVHAEQAKEDLTKIANGEVPEITQRKVKEGYE